MATAEDDDEFWAQVWMGSVNDSDSLLESVRQARDDVIGYPSAHPLPESAHERWVKCMTAWQALLEVYQVLHCDERHELAQQVLTWALTQVNNAGQAALSDDDEEAAWYQAPLLESHDHDKQGKVHEMKGVVNEKPA